MVLLTKEQELVESIKEWTGSRFIGDDCALLPGGLLVTSDSLVEQTHFVWQWTKPEDLGWKACAVNLSDIAAMAGRADFLTVSLTLSPTLDREHLHRFYQSFVECARTYKAQVVGGDLTAGSLIVINVTALGTVNESGCLKRSGAKVGDAVVVTGDFGASAAGLWLLGNETKEKSRQRFSYCLSRHTRPIPRLAESWALVKRVGERGSLMDASDGLADALVQISRSSRVGMEIESEAVPVHAETQAVATLAGVDPLEWMLYGGEDYELVGTLSDEAWRRWQHGTDNPFIKIGVVTGGQDVTLTSRSNASRIADLSKCFQQIDFT